MTHLGVLEKVELRDIWETEAQDFTPWLAQEHNLAILSETISVELELEAQERSVGPFRADILCRNLDSPEDEAWVLIENQLEKTDHIHLGQLLTYAAGLHTCTIVWISAKFSEEHRAALDWLNEITADKFKFFGLEVELWRIGESPAAPKFNIISKPNDWSRSVTKAARKITEDDLNPTKLNYLNYWGAMADYLSSNSKILRPQKPMAAHWSNLSIGRSGFGLATLGAVKDDWIAVELSMKDENAKAYFYLLEKDREEIDRELGFSPEWMALPDKKMTRIRIKKLGENPLNTEKWDEHFAWFMEKLEAFDRVFRARIKSLNAEEWVDENSQDVA